MPSPATTEHPASTGAPRRTRADALRDRLPEASAGMLGLIVLTQLANVVNYGSNLVFSRVLEPVGYGELTSLLALAVVLAVPLAAAQTVIAERVSVAHAAGDEARVQYLVRFALGHVLTLGTVVGIAYIAAIPLIVNVLDIRQPGPVIALAPFVVLSFVTAVAYGALQGTERFVAYGSVVFSGAVFRLAFGGPWAAAGGGAGGAIGGQALGLLVVLGFLAWRYREALQRRGTAAAWRGLRRRIDLTALAASGAFIGFALLSNLDIVLARLFLSQSEAGIYAALSTIAKLVIFLPGAVAILMVPSAVRAHAADDGFRSRRVLRLAATAALASTVVVGLPAILAPGQLVNAMFGSGYESARDGVLPMVIAGTGLALLYMVCTYTVAIRDRRWLILLTVGVALQVSAIAVFHDSPASIAWAQAGVITTVLVLNEIAFHSLLPRRRSVA